MRNSIVFHDVVHHLANVGKASATLGVLGSTQTCTSFFFRHDSIHNGGLSIRQDIPLDVGGGVTEAITYQSFYHFLLQMLLIRCPTNMVRYHELSSSTKTALVNFHKEVNKPQICTLSHLPAKTESSQEFQKVVDLHILRKQSWGGRFQMAGMEESTAVRHAN
jgi:hypothetical protein